MLRYIRATIGAVLVFVVVYMVVAFPLLSLFDGPIGFRQWAVGLGIIVIALAAAASTFFSSLRSSKK